MFRLHWLTTLPDMKGFFIAGSLRLAIGEEGTLGRLMAGPILADAATWTGLSVFLMDLKGRLLIPSPSVASFLFVAIGFIRLTEGCFIRTASGSVCSGATIFTSASLS